MAEDLDPAGHRALDQLAVHPLQGTFRDDAHGIPHLVPAAALLQADVGEVHQNGAVAVVFHRELVLIKVGGPGVAGVHHGEITVGHPDLKHVHQCAEHLLVDLLGDVQLALGKKLRGGVHEPEPISGQGVGLKAVLPDPGGLAGAGGSPGENKDAHGLAPVTVSLNDGSC